MSEHRLQFAGRAADDPQHVGGGGLLLQRFAQLVEQPGVLDGDDGLSGEVRDQLDLLVGERAHLLAVDDDRADQLVLLEHRHGSNGASAGELDDGDAARVALAIGVVGREVGDVNRPASCRQHAAERVHSGRGNASARAAAARRRPAGRRATRRMRKTSPSRQQQVAELGLADAHRVRQHGLEHRLQLAGRAGDDAAAPPRSRSAAAAIRAAR